MTSPKDFGEMFYGSVTLGERGQVVIPAELRKLCGLSAGDRLLAFRHPFGTGVVLIRMDALEEWMDGMRRSMEAARAQMSQPDADPMGEDASG